MIARSYRFVPADRPQRFGKATAAETLRARRLDFGAKLCIHPAQVQAVNRAFSPSAQEIAWAGRVLDAASAAGGAAVAVDGKMVDRPDLAALQRYRTWPQA